MKMLYEIHRHDLMATRNVLQEASKEIGETLKDSGGCDHSVGICWCEVIRLMERIDARIQVLDRLVEDQTCQCCWHDQHDGGFCGEKDEDGVPCDCNQTEEP